MLQVASMRFVKNVFVLCWLWGFDKNESIEFNQRNPAGLIWANVMSRIHSGKSSAEFVKTSGIYILL